VPAPRGEAAGPQGLGSRREIRLSGSGGQGLILAATVLAEALLASGTEVVQTQSYGPEARGGASKAEIIVSDAEIDFPEVVSPDVTLCLSQEAFDDCAAETRPGGVVIYDRGLVSPAELEGVELVGLPFSHHRNGATLDPSTIDPPTWLGPGKRLQQRFSVVRDNSWTLNGHNWL
jgi:Pyruvate/2-oxoacid:ferredoxin oxidoreductase gamma subunit